MNAAASTLRPATLLLSGLAALTAVTLSACSSSSGSAAARTSSGATSASAAVSAPAPSTSAATSHAVAHGPGRARVHVTGAISIDAVGSGAYCNYFYPALKQGVAYHVSSTSVTGPSSAGGWDLTISDDTGHNLSIILNTGRGSWTAGRSVVGTVHAQTNLHHADFDVDMTKVVGQQHAHLTGSIDCP